MFQEVTFQARKNKKDLPREKFLIFLEMETLKNFLYFKK